MLETTFLIRIQDAKHTNWKEVEVSKNDITLSYGTQNLLSDLFFSLSLK